MAAVMILPPPMRALMRIEILAKCAATAAGRCLMLEPTFR